jgi:tetratricopeptide (TPR) repeat protein
MTAHRCVDSNQVSNLNDRWVHHLTFESSISGESPPPPSRTFFGRDELIEKIVDLAENLIPIALIGPGGIGKTSIALAVLHHDRIKEQFGNDRRFVRCDQFPTSRAHLLRQLSNVIGAGVEGPEDLTPLRAFLSSKKMLIVLDNAESILDPQGTDAQEIYAVVDELSQFNNICVCITSRISTIPPNYRHLDVPTLPMEAARDTFYHTYNTSDRSNLVNTILEQLNFHPLSITLLATVAHQNKWDTNRLAREWKQRRMGVLQTEYRSLAATIEISFASPLFQGLGPDARALLGVVAFFPQGVDEKNLDWLFPTISNGTDVFSKFCTLSLTYRSNEFVTMLAPFRDYLRPKDPKSSPILCATKTHYFTRMSVNINPNKPNFGESQWITSEDVNVEHLLDVFTTIDANSDSVWRACANFMQHLVWHKKRLVTLKPKIEGLPDDHSSKPKCLFELSRLFDSVGNREERKRLLTRALELEREKGNVHQVTRVLRHLSDANRLMGLLKEGIQQATEAFEILERSGDTLGQARCLMKLALLLCDDKQFNAAEEAASRAIGLIAEKGSQSLVCESHRVLGNIHRSKGETEKAVHQYEVALEIASSSNWHGGLFQIHHTLAGLFRDEGRLDDAHTHIKHAKLHTTNSPYNLGCAMEQQAWVWYKQHRFEEARSEATHAADVYEKLGAAEDTENCRKLLQRIQKKLNSSVISGQSGSQPVAFPTTGASPGSGDAEPRDTPSIANGSRPQTPGVTSEPQSPPSRNETPDPDAEPKRKRVASQNFQRLARRISIGTRRSSSVLGIPIRNIPGFRGEGTSTSTNPNCELL